MISLIDSLYCPTLNSALIMYSIISCSSDNIAGDGAYIYLAQSVSVLSPPSFGS